MAAEVAGGAAGGPGSRHPRDTDDQGVRAAVSPAPTRSRGTPRTRTRTRCGWHVVPVSSAGVGWRETDRTGGRGITSRRCMKAGRSANTIRQAKVVLGRDVRQWRVADSYLDYNPFHDVKIPKGCRGGGPIQDRHTGAVRRKVRGLPSDESPRSGVLDAAGVQRECGSARQSGCRPADFDFEAGILESGTVGSQGCLVSIIRRAKNVSWCATTRRTGRTRRLKLDGAVVELVRGYVAEHGIGATEGDVPGGAGGSAAGAPRRGLTEGRKSGRWGDCEPVGGRVYGPTGRLGGLRFRRGAGVRGAGQWARDYGRERMRRVRRAAASGTARRRWGESLVMPTSPTWTSRSGTGSGPARSPDSGIPFKPTAYQGPAYACLVADRRPGRTRRR